MDEMADQLISQLNIRTITPPQLNELAARLASELESSQNEAKEAIIKAIVRYRLATPRPLTAYERILDDVANGRSRPPNFDASGP
jgi:hypothetical protein